MKLRIVSVMLAAGLCAAVASTSFAQSVGSARTSVPRVRALPPVLVRPPVTVAPKGAVQNWAAVAAVGAAIVAATSVAHHAKESWYPGIKPIAVINPATTAMFDVQAAR